MDPRSRQNQRAWDVAATRYVVETDALLAQARTGTALRPEERELLGPVLAASPRVVHLQSGHGLEDLDLVRAGARTVVGVDFSRVTAGAAHRRARRLGMAPPVGYVVGDALRVGLRGECADLVYTGKGALMWLPDIGAWAREVARLLRPGGHLFVHEAHPAACLWTRDTDPVRVDPRHGYFGGTRVNDTFPASAIDRYGAGQGLDAVEWQWTLADVVGATLAAGLELRHLDEHPDPFWRPVGATSAAWAGHLPNSLSLLCRRASDSGDG